MTGEIPLKSSGGRCPECRRTGSKIVEVRGPDRHRRRVCGHCGTAWTTVEITLPSTIKRKVEND
jgi:transcriptional regulator NrdR family protein